MSIFKRPSCDLVFRTFTDRGWFFACPVYLNEVTGCITERRWVPECWYDVNMVLFLAVEFVLVVARGQGFPGYPIFKTGRIGNGNGSP
jgi:hypothetical protein